MSLTGCDPPLPSSERQAHYGIVQALRQRLVQVIAEPNKQACARALERRLERIKRGYQRPERDECRDAAARQHAVVNLQHKKGPVSISRLINALNAATPTKALLKRQSASASSDRLPGWGEKSDTVAAHLLVSTPLLVCHGRIKGLSRLHLQT